MHDTLVLSFLSIVTVIDTARIGSVKRSVRLSVPSIDSSSGVRRVCCWAPREWEITSIAGAGAQQQMRAMSFWQPRHEAEHGLVIVVVAVLLLLLLLHSIFNWWQVQNIVLEVEYFVYTALQQCQIPPSHCFSGCYQHTTLTCHLVYKTAGWLSVISQSSVIISVDILLFLWCSDMNLLLTSE